MATCCLDVAELANYLLDQAEQIVRFEFFPREILCAEATSDWDVRTFQIVRRHFTSCKVFEAMFAINVDIFTLRNVSLHQRAKTILLTPFRSRALDHRILTSLEMLVDLIVGNYFPAASLGIIADKIKL